MIVKHWLSSLQNVQAAQQMMIMGPVTYQLKIIYFYVILSFWADHSGL